MSCINCDGDCNCGCDDLTIPAGEDGVGIDHTELSGDDLIIFYTDGTTETVGPVVGADGLDGSVWHDGSGAPAGGLGVDGDYYLDVDTGDVYNKTGGLWAIVGNIQGPQGPQGDPGIPGPGGVASSIDFSSGDIYNNSTPNVIYDVGWSGTTTNGPTDSSRFSFGDLHVIQGTLDFNGTWNGIGSTEILIEVPGPTLNPAEGSRVVQLITWGGNFEHVQSYFDDVAGTNYVRFLIPKTIPTSPTTFNIRYYLLLLYSS
jgi:hypothetical protein